MENWMIEVGRQLIEECQWAACGGCGVDVEMLPLLWSCQVAGWQQQRGPVIAPYSRPWNNLHSAHWAYLLHTQHLHYIAQWACSGGKYVSIRILLKHKISVLTLFTVVVVHRCCCRTLLRRARDSPDCGELVPARWPRWSWELRRPLLSYIPNLWLTVQCSAPTILHHLQSVETSIQASDQTLVPVHFYSLQHNIKQSFFGGDCWKCLTFKKVCISLHHHNLWKEKFLLHNSENFNFANFPCISFQVSVIFIGK